MSRFFVPSVLLFSVYLVFCLIIPRSPRSTLFPYTTLFRSGPLDKNWLAIRGLAQEQYGFDLEGETEQAFGAPQACSVSPSRRSEEHTSELQSQSNLVCRLLLEKKKKYRQTRDQTHQPLTPR